MTSLVEAVGLSIEGRLTTTAFSSSGSELIAAIGPNGGGKTSLLRALARVEGVGGTVLVDGQALDKLGEAHRRRLVAFLPASREVAWPIAVRDLIALGLPAKDVARVEELVDAFALGSLGDRAIGSLSTGERARALLARALAARPHLLLLDEPLSNLDPYWVLRTMDLLRTAAAGGSTVIVALHDIGQIDKFDRLLLLDDGQVVADGTPTALKDRVGALFGVEAIAGGGWRIR